MTINQIKSCTILILYLIMNMLVSGLKANEMESTSYVKQQVERQLAEDLKTLKQLREVLKQRMANQVLLRDSFEKTFNQVTALKDFVEKQSPENLPSALVALFIEESNKSSSKYPFVNNSHSPFMTLLYPTPSYFIILGELVVEPLIKNYNHAQRAKEHIIDVLGKIGSPTALPLILQETHSHNHRIRIKAIKLLSQLMGEKAILVLSQLLEGQNIQAQDRQIIELILAQIKSLNQTQWLTTIVSMLQAKKLSPDYLWRFNSYFKGFPGAEDGIGKHIPFLLMQLSDDNYLGRMGQKNAVMLLSLLKHRTYLKQLFPIFEELLKVRFYYGKVFTLWNKDFKSNSVGAWNFTSAQLILENIEAGLLIEDIQQWLNKPLKNGLTKLYLEQLLLKKGNFSKPISLENILIAVTVLDSQNRVIASQHHRVPLGKKIVLKGKPQVPDYPIHTYSASFSFDTEKLQIVMDSFLINFKPHGARFDGRMPFGGSLEIKFHEKFQGKSQVSKWLIKHIDEEAETRMIKMMN